MRRPAHTSANTSPTYGPCVDRRSGPQPTYPHIEKKPVNGTGRATSSATGIIATWSHRDLLQPEVGGTSAAGFGSEAFMTRWKAGVRGRGGGRAT